MTLPSDPTKIQPITSTINRTAEDLCDTICDTGDCSTRCKYACPQYCQDYVPVSEPIIPFDDNGDHHHHKTSSLLIAMLSLIGATLLILGIYIAYVKIQNSRRRRHQESRIIRTDESDDVSDIDEDQGTVVDHPIWYIRTVGLQPSVISSIMVFKYKKGEGLIEGTECSVCLTEFDEDETLRLLPKCSHAFHVPCIDTWLRSHTNCPMCRAPIVANSVSRVQAVEQDSGNENLAGEEGIREENPVGNDGFSRDMESGVQELRIGIEGDQELDSQGGRKRHEVDRIQPVRRSVSLDCLAASKISLAVSNVLPVQSGKSSGVGKFGGKSSGGNVRVGSSSSGRYLQNGPGLMRRSLSLSGQILQSVYSRSQSSVLPL